jgi:hypothetical protein
MGFRTLRRLRKRAATCTGFASSGCAAPPGFLSLLALYSARNLLALFHASNALGLRAFRGFPFPVARTASRHPFPSCCFSPRSRHQRTDAVHTSPQLQGFAHPESPYRLTRCYPRKTDRSSLSLRPVRGFYPSGLDHVFPRSLLSWAFTSRWTASRPSRRWLCRVSKNQRTDSSLSRSANLPGFCRSPGNRKRKPGFGHRE